MTAPSVPGETITALTESDARRLTAEIRLVATSVHQHLDRLQDLIDRAATGNVHQVLGYQSWPAYLADTLGSQSLKLGTADRQALVAYMSGTGVSTRGIATALGVSKTTVNADLQVSRIGTPAAGDEYGIDPAEPRFGLTEDEHEQALALARESGDSSAGAVNTAAEKVLNDRPSTTTKPTPATTGLDGKSYPRRPQQAPRRTDITKAGDRAGRDVRRLTARLEKISNDDRLTRNRAMLARELVGPLRQAITAYRALLDQLGGSMLDELVPGATVYIDIDVPSDTASVVAGRTPVQQVLDHLGITGHRGSDGLRFSAQHVGDVRAVLEDRGVNCFVQSGDPVASDGA